MCCPCLQIASACASVVDQLQVDEPPSAGGAEDLATLLQLLLTRCVLCTSAPPLALCEGIALQLQNSNAISKV